MSSMSMKDTQRSPMFLLLERAEIERIRRFGEVRAYGAGEALFKVGEVGHGLFVVLAGNVDLIRHLESGALKTFVTQGPGAVLAEIAQLVPRRSEFDWLRPNLDRPSTATIESTQRVIITAPRY